MDVFFHGQIAKAIFHHAPLTATVPAHPAPAALRAVVPESTPEGSRMCPAHAVAEAGSRSSRRPFLAGVCLAIALLVPVASGCSTLLTAAYLIAPACIRTDWALCGRRCAIYPLPFPLLGQDG